MKISHIEIYRFSIPMVPFKIATGTMEHAQNVFIRIHTSDGIYGVGECSAFPMICGETQDTCLIMAREFAKLWKGKDPFEIKDRMSELHHFTTGNSTIKSAFDMALFDISSKAVSAPLYKFLGGEKREVETDITIGIGSVTEMVNQATEFVSSGARILKIKVGKHTEDDINRIIRIREAVGSTIILRIDANQGWDLDNALNVLQKVAHCSIQFCEQPLHKDYDDLLPQLKTRSSIPIMADESCFNHHDARKLISSNACDLINIKLSKSSGILEALNIYDTATLAGIPCMIGGMLESRIALSAKLHFAYACPQISFFDLDTCMIGHLEDPCTGGLTYNAYHLSIEDAPGIGADADESFLKKCEKLVI